ncbi:hypothetical protein RSAG8_13559, partial [Rhizoctonia solani AG-8 WAC10335]
MFKCPLYALPPIVELAAMAGHLRAGTGIAGVAIWHWSANGSKQRDCCKPEL